MPTSQSLNLRRPNEDDVPEIVDIAEEIKHILPKRFAHAAVVESEDEIKSFGVIRYILEGLLYTIGSDRDKVESLKLLIEQAIKDAKSKNEDLYIFAQDENFAAILEKHFGFRRLNTVPMMLDLEQ